MLFTGAAPPGGGRSVVTPRFTRHYNVFCVPPASEAVMKVIFGEADFGELMEVRSPRFEVLRCLHFVDVTRI